MLTRPSVQLPLSWVSPMPSLLILEVGGSYFQLNTRSCNYGRPVKLMAGTATEPQVWRVHTHVCRCVCCTNALQVHGLVSLACLAGSSATNRRLPRVAIQGDTPHPSCSEGVADEHTHKSWLRINRGNTLALARRQAVVHSGSCRQEQPPFTFSRPSRWIWNRWCHLQEQQQHHQHGG